MPGQSRQAVEGVPNGIEPRDRNVERSLALRLCHDLIYPRPQVEIGPAEGLFRGQQGDSRTAPRRVFLDGARRTKPKAVGAMPVQTRDVQLVVTGNMRRRLARGEAAVDFRPLEMLTCRARSSSCP